MLWLMRYKLLKVLFLQTRKVLVLKGLGRPKKRTKNLPSFLLFEFLKSLVSSGLDISASPRETYQTTYASGLTQCCTPRNRVGTIFNSIIKVDLK